MKELWADPDGPFRRSLLPGGAMRKALDEGWAVDGVIRAAVERAWAPGGAARLASEAGWAEGGATRVGVARAWEEGGATRLASERRWAPGGASRLASEEGWADDGVYRKSLEDGPMWEALEKRLEEMMHVSGLLRVHSKESSNIGLAFLADRVPRSGYHDELGSAQSLLALPMLQRWE